MQIIIVGLGRTGTVLAAQLSAENNSVTVVDVDAQLVEEFSSRLDIMGIAGNGASYSVLREAGIETADVLIAVTETDEFNLLCCLIAKKAGRCRTVARVRSPVFNQEINFLKQELGLSLVINTQLAAANEISRLLKVPSAIEIEPFAGGRAELLRFKLKKGSILDGMQLRDLNRSLGTNILVCAAVRANEIYIPSGTFSLQTGDEISIVSTPGEALDFLRKAGFDTDQADSTIIAGGGGISYYLARELLDLGIYVKIIEKDLKRCEILSEMLPKATIICGDALDNELLLEEGLLTADSLAALTDIDEENIMLSLYTKNISDEKIKTITKVTRITFDDVIGTLDLGSVIVPSRIIADIIVRYVRALNNSVGSSVETLYKIIGGKAEALEFIVSDDCELIGKSLSEMNLRENVLIGCINRKGRIIVPQGSDIFEKGDTVIVVTSLPGLDELSDISAG